MFPTKQQVADLFRKTCLKLLKYASFPTVRGARVSLGLTKSEAEVYVHLAKQGPQKAKTIAEALTMHEQLVYRSLRSLKSKEIVSATLEHPTEFCTVPFERALELLMKAHLKESQNIEREKDEILIAN